MTATAASSSTAGKEWRTFNHAARERCSTPRAWSATTRPKLPANVSIDDTLTLNSCFIACNSASSIALAKNPIPRSSEPDRLRPVQVDRPRASESSKRDVIRSAPLAPDSGQRMRLRGGAGPWEGYVEVRMGSHQPWGHMCDAIDAWTLQEANVVCQHLGFSRLLLLFFFFTFPAIFKK